jgi:hypothetical protein
MPKLSPEQRAELERQLAEDDASEDDFEVEIRDGDKSTRVPYSKAKKWLGETFGIDLDDTSQDDPELEGKPKAKPEGGEVRRFGGRRVS